MMIEITKEELTQATKEYGKKHIAHRMANVLLALSEQKPSAFVMKDDLADPAIVSTPAYLDIEDAEQKTIGDIVALYADPFPVIGDTTALVDDILSILALLEAGDWSEHCTKTELGGRLEREITRLIGDAQEATVTSYELIAEAWRLMDGQDPKTSDWHSKASKYLNSNIVEKVDDDRIEAVKAVLRRLSGNYPVTPDGWISCSERMPEKNQNVLISVNFDSSLVEPLICSARYTGSTFRRGDATIKPGNGIEQATHWMPLPEPPQEVS